MEQKSTLQGKNFFINDKNKITFILYGQCYYRKNLLEK